MLQEQYKLWIVQVKEGKKGLYCTIIEEEEEKKMYWTSSIGLKSKQQFDPKELVKYTQKLTYDDSFVRYLNDSLSRKISCE